MSYIVALDIGIASVGWAVIDKESETVVEAGSNIFPEATAAENQTRREMRQSRRLKRRQRTRLNDFNKLWSDFGLDIPDSYRNEIVQLKVKGLNEQLTIDEVYLVLYSYLKHRGISYLEDSEEDIKGNSSYAKGLALNEKELKTKHPCEIQQERLKTLGKYRGQTQIVKGDEKIDLSNVFTISAYRKEVEKFLSTQQYFYKELTEEFVEKYLKIFNRKRKYYEGPGNEKSRTDYGKYTTLKNENGEYITEKNIFEKLIGKCSVYSDELRAAGASYTAQEFNLLNDLNNLVVNGRKLEKKEKETIVEKVKNSDTIKMRKIISEAINDSIEGFSGYRVDKNDKEEFHKFEAYNKIRKELRAIEVDIKEFSIDDLNKIGHILTINTDRESIEEAFNNSELDLNSNIIDCLINVRKKNGTLFNKWHSFSLKIMNELIPLMYEESKEQMTILTEMGKFKGKSDKFKDSTYIPIDTANDEIFNPVVRRSVRISFRILNALMKKYKDENNNIEISDVVIEMPRDRNSEEQKKYIKDTQKKNENEIKYIEKNLKENYDIKDIEKYYSLQKNLLLKLKLWNEQDGICLYSGRAIDPKDIIIDPNKFEIDHIIPRSISFDDSRSNKVLVYSSENQKKGNQTPYYYLTHSNNDWTFDQFKAKVIELSKKKEYRISRKKVQNLLFSEDITKIDVQKGFINRNLNDTRYASRVVLNTLSSFFRAKEEDVKVKVIRGSYTHQMRVNMNLKKDREESFSHHAVDAMLIAFSQLGYESYRKLQGEFIDFETGEILDKNMWESNMSDKVYADYLYGQKWSNIRTNIVNAEKNVKYWYYVDHKSNRGLCNQTIRGTRVYDDKIYKINKFDIRTKDGVKLFKKFALSKKESDKEKLLVYKNDRKTFDNLVQIFNDYSDAKNPFVEYEKETGDLVRKYSKKHNGPVINKLKYTDGEVGACIDVSHKYGYEKNSKKVILESLVPYRTDVYYKPENKMYYLVGVKQSDIKCDKEGNYVIDEDKYSLDLINEKMIENGQNRSDLQNLGYVFKFSLYKNDIIEYEKGNESFKERFHSRTMPKARNYIETKPINKNKFEKQKLIGLGNTKVIKKYYMDILGNWHLCKNEEFSIYC